MFTLRESWSYAPLTRLEKNSFQLPTSFRAVQNSFHLISAAQHTSDENMESNGKGSQTVVDFEELGKCWIIKTKMKL